jgi:ribosomal protein S21
MIQVEVAKTGNENTLSMIRKFTRRVQSAGIVQIIRNGRYYSRLSSKTVKKKRALKLIKRRVEFAQLLKEGKITETVNHRGTYNRPQHSTESIPTVSSTKSTDSTPIAS